MKKKAQKMLSGLMLLALVFSLGASALPKQVKAAGEDFLVGFHLEGSYSTEGLNGEIEIVVEDRQLGGVRGDIQVGYQITYGMNPASYASSTSADDFVFNNSADTSGTITIPASASSVLIPVQDIDDLNVENREAFTITLTGVLTTGATVALSRAYPSHFHAIDDNDSATVSIANVPEGNTSGQEGSGPGSFKVLLSKVSPVDVTFDWSVFDSTATFPDDFSIPGGRATIPAGQTSTTLSIGVVDDNVQEFNEQVVLIKLSNPINAVFGARSETFYYITDNDATAVSFAETSIGGLENVGTVPITVLLNYPRPNPVTVDIDFMPQSGGARMPGDFSLPANSVTFAPNVTSVTFDLVINNDNLQELDEYLRLQLVNAIEVNGTSRVVIFPNIWLDYLIQDDGDVSNVSTLNFTGLTGSGSEDQTGLVTVSLDTPATQDVTFQWKVDSGSASINPSTVGATNFPADFTGGSATYITSTILAGGSAVVLDLGVVNDNLAESDETINLSLTNVVGADLGPNNTHTYTIVDNDLPSVQFRNTASSGTENITNPSFVLELSNPSQTQVNVYFANEVSSTATYNTDWSLHGLVASILPGSTTTEMSIDVVDDATQEPSENALFNIDYADNAVVGVNKNYTYTITDNDAPTPPPTSGGGGGSGSSSGGGSAIPTVILGSGSFDGENLSVKVDSLTTVGDMTFANLVLVGGTATRMSISNNASFENATQEVYKTTAMWKLPSTAGEKKIFVKFFNNAGAASVVVSTTVDTAGNPGGQVLGVKVTLLDELIAKLKSGTTSDEVKQLQVELQKAGFFAKTFKPTRLYGAMTKAAVAKYLASKNAVVLSFDELVNTLTVGSRGANVVRLQTELKKRGFFPAGTAVTTYYGPMTKAAVAKYLASK